MRRMRLVGLLPLAFPLMAAAQLTNSTDAQILQSARSNYYNLEAAGFQGLKCKIAFDFSTVPLLSESAEETTRKLLQRTPYYLEIDDKGRSRVHHLYPADASDLDKQQAARVADLLTSFVSGVFLTWPSKALQGPIPAFDSQVEKVVSAGDGYEFYLRAPGAPVVVEVNGSHIVTKITSLAGKLVEQPIYAPSPEGLVFAGIRAQDTSDSAGIVDVKYDLGLIVLDGLRIPNKVHLQVNKNIDVNYVLNECAVKKATVVLHMDLPGVGTKP